MQQWPNEKIHDAIFSRQYQRDGVRFIARTDDVMLTDQPGLGKTIQTLAGIAMRRNHYDRPRRTLILGPKISIENVWTKEALSWLGDSVKVIPVTGSKAKRQAILAKALDNPFDDRDKIVVCNSEMVRIKGVKNEHDTVQFHVENAMYPELFSIVWDNIVVDESHRVLIRKGGTPTQQRSGMMKLRAHNKVALSGTPMLGKPHQLWGTLNWLRPYEYHSYWNWVREWFDCYSDGFSDFVIGDCRDPDGLAKSLEGIMLRRTKSEVATQLPPKMYNGEHLYPSDKRSPIGIWLEMTPQQKRLYERLDKEGILGTNMIANGRLAADTRRRIIASSELNADDLVSHKITHKLPSPKFDWLLDKLAELDIEPGKPNPKGQRIVIASQYTSVIDFYDYELKNRDFFTFKLTGKTTPKSRQEQIASFQSDEPRAQIFLVNMKAGGVAVTLDAADDLVMLDETYIPDESEQMEDRIHRVSRNHPVTIHYLRMLGTIEEEIALINAARYDVQAYLLDGTRGVETARQIFQKSIS